MNTWNGDGRSADPSVDTSAIEVVPSTGDPVLAALGRAEAAYREARTAWSQEAVTAEDAIAARDRAEAELRRVAADLKAERAAAAGQRERAKRLAAALKDVHRALFTGNVFDLILRACMTLTGATRGLYVAVHGDRSRVRAAVDVDGYPREAPSAFVRALCKRAIDTGKPFTATGPDAPRDLPRPDRPGEEFAELLVVPAVVMNQAHGVVILGDKPGGFKPHDADEVLAIGDQAGVAVENARLREELLGAYHAVVGVLADAIEAKDAYVRGHSEAVAELARRTAAKLTDSAAVRSIASYGGLLHDIGKIGVSDGVLHKPGKLSPEEWVLMQSHTRLGRELLARVPALDGVAEVVLHHHERYDGTGYPDGLKGEAIPLAARIVGVVDAYSAMTAKRSYKESMPPDAARAELVRGKGTHFDPQVVDAFLQVLDELHGADGLAGHAPPPGLGERLAGDFHLALRRPATAKA
jgi:HD-GYP domain-containing protein (c-di-GMP phosphodiesterase class II)